MNRVQLAWGARTDVGLRREANEDALIAEYPLFLVADGMGGHEAGNVASARALGAFRHLIGRDAVSLDEFAAAFVVAVAAVERIEAKRAAGTTISGLAVSEVDGASYWLVMNIGDSRTYRLADGVLEQISVDHSAVQELIEQGKLTMHDAESHPERHVITRAVGAGSHSEPDYWLIPASRGDRLLVCSDGLSKELEYHEIAQVLQEEQAPEAAAVRLVHEALLRGGRDNVSVIVVDALTVDDDDFPTVPAGADEPEMDTVPRVSNQEGATDG
ncbi:MAG: PP2C family protein-serine/threonine phosphatase [Propionicimonas sp.]